MVYVDIYNTNPERGITVEAFEFRMQGWGWLEAKLDYDSEWITIAERDPHVGWIYAVKGDAFGDLSFHDEPSGLFPVHNAADWKE